MGKDIIKNSQKENELEKIGRNTQNVTGQKNTG